MSAASQAQSAGSQPRPSRSRASRLAHDRLGRRRFHRAARRSTMLVGHVSGRDRRTPEIAAARTTQRSSCAQSPRDEALKAADPRVRPAAPPALFPPAVPDEHRASICCSAASRCFLFAAAARPRSGANHLPMPASRSRGGRNDAGAPPSPAGRWPARRVVAARLLSLDLGLSSALPANRARRSRSSLRRTPTQPQTAAARLPRPPQNCGATGRASAGPAATACRVAPTRRERGMPTTGAGIAWKVPSPAAGLQFADRLGRPRLLLRRRRGEARGHLPGSRRPGRLLWRQAIANVPGSPAAAARDSGIHRLCGPDHGHRRPARLCDVRQRRLGRVHSGRQAGLVQRLRRAARIPTAMPPRWPPGGPADRATRPGRSEDGKSKLYALDGRTGQVVWQKPRKLGASWASPIVIEAAGKAQIITLSLPLVICLRRDRRRGTVAGRLPERRSHALARSSPAGMVVRRQPFGQSCSPSGRTARAM